MKEIDQHIKLLLASHDCVIIPNLGAFIADYKPARVENQEKPKKALLFNTHLKRNDGLLINTLVEGNQLDYRQAKEEVNHYVEEIITLLNTGESYTLEGIGTFQLDKAGFIQFLEHEDNEFLLENYGLPSVNLKKIIRNKTEKGQSNKDKILNYSLKIAAAVILIFVVFYTSQSQLDNPKSDQASLNFISDTPSLPEIQQATIAPTDSLITAPIEKEIIHTPEIKQAVYHVIIGSLTTQAAAQLHLNIFKQKYPFEDINIIQGNQRFRISAAQFAKQEEAQAYIKTLKSLDQKTFKDAWTLYQ